jgi:hypothetical protein
MANDRNFGGYFGVGFGYNKVTISESSWNGHGITAGAYYKIGIGSQNNLNTIGFNILYDL